MANAQALAHGNSIFFFHLAVKSKKLPYEFTHILRLLDATSNG